VLLQLNRRSFCLQCLPKFGKLRSRCIWLLLCQSQPQADTLAFMGSRGLSSNVCSGQCATMLDLVGVTFGWCTMILCKALKQHIHQLCCNTVCRSARLTTRPLIVVLWHKGWSMHALMSLLCLPQMCISIPQSAQSCRTLASGQVCLMPGRWHDQPSACAWYTVTYILDQLSAKPSIHAHTALPHQAMCREQLLKRYAAEPTQCSG
jgi:hypothetical protein